MPPFAVSSVGGGSEGGRFSGSEEGSGGARKRGSSFVLSVLLCGSLLFSLPRVGVPGAPPLCLVWGRPVRPLSWRGGAALGSLGPLPLLPVGPLLGSRLWGGFSPLPLGCWGFGVNASIVLVFHSSRHNSDGIVAQVSISRVVCFSVLNKSAFQYLHFCCCSQPGPCLRL